MTDEQEFKKHADHAVGVLKSALISASDDYGFEVAFRGGALTVEFEYPPAKIVIQPNASARQISVAAPSKSYKLDWDVVENTFMHTESGQSLKEVIEQVLSKHVKSDVSL